MGKLLANHLAVVRRTGPAAATRDEVATAARLEAQLAKVRADRDKVREPRYVPKGQAAAEVGLDIGHGQLLELRRRRQGCRLTRSA